MTDTIVALSTAPGVGAVAMVRVSGPEAFRVLRRIVPDLAGLPEARRAVLVRVRDPFEGDPVDRALVTCFPGPESYTGEDMVEISGHGGFLAPSLVLEACLAAGARRAAPGEFTRRAYLNGKMDLVQAEAVVDVVQGRSRALHGAALGQLERGLSERIAGIRERLVSLEVLLMHHIDFPEEDQVPVPLARIVEEARGVEGRLAAFLETAPEGELLREGALTVLAGTPNAGKSSLFNALVGEERAIVTEIPGTTRDAIEAVVSMGGFPFRLVDTAGLGRPREPVERLGVEVARRYLERADVVVFCAEAGRRLRGEERRFLDSVEGPVLRVRTKADLAREGRGAGGELRDDGSSEGLRVSVVTGEGLGRLREALPGLVYRGLVAQPTGAPVITRERQRRSVARAHREVAAFAAALEAGVPSEVAATHLRPAETALEEVLGIITRDEILDEVFQTFCIGK